MERLWMTLDQIKVEYASNDYNPELLLQHLLHHVEASPASAPEGWKIPKPMEHEPLRADEPMQVQVGMFDDDGNMLTFPTSEQRNA